MNSGAVRNVLVTIGAQLISWGLTLLVTLYLPRYLGDTGLGKLAFVGSLISIFGVIVPLGTSTLLVKEISRDRGRTGELLRAVKCLRLPLAFIMIGIAVGSVTILGYSSLTRVLVLVGGISMLVETANDALSAALRGQENFPKQTGSMLVERFLASGLTIIIVLMQGPIWMIAGLGIVTNAVGFAINYSAFAPLLRTLRGLPDVGTLRSVVISGLPFLGWTAFQTLYGQIDPLALSIIAGDAAVGWYAAAFRLMGTALFVPVAVTTALMPTLSRLYHSDPEQFRRLSRQMLSVILVSGVPIAAVLICIPDALIALLHFPESFAASIPVLRIGGVGILLWYVATVLGTTVIASDGQSGMLRASVMAAFFGVPVCFLCSYTAHRIWGNAAIGAMVSDILTELLLLFVYVRLLPRGFFGRESILLFGKCMLSAIPMAFCLLVLTKSYGLLAALTAGTTLYILLCLAMRCVEIRQIIELLQSVISARRSRETSG